MSWEFVPDATFEQGKVAYEKIRSQDFSCEDLWTPGKKSVIPYPGIGPVPRRPGLDFTFIGRYLVLQVLELIEEGNKTIDLCGAKGVGKSSVLRAVGASLINGCYDNEKIISIWSLEMAMGRLVDAWKDAFLFAYCKDLSACETITSLTSIDELCQFIQERKAVNKETFYFIIDNVTSTGEERDDKDQVIKRKTELLKVVEQGVSCIFGFSPQASSIVDSSRQASRFRMSIGMENDSLKSYMETSVLGELCDQFPERMVDVNYYGGMHPLSLSVLDRVCRDYAAQQRSSSVPTSGKRRRGFPLVTTLPDKAETLLYLRDPEDWDQVVRRFMRSSSLSAIAARCEIVVKRKGLTRLYTLGEMLAADKRYGLEDELGNLVDYCTPYIRRLHTEAFRRAERHSFHGGAWVPYCEYLLRLPVGVNWSEMGWLCEHLFSDVLTHHGGMVLDDIHIQGNMRTIAFTSPPAYNTWFPSLKQKVCDGIFFLPLKWNLEAIDGAVAFRDSAGKMHFVALQATTNEKSHHQSIQQFMNLAIVEKWIPFEEKPGEDFLPKDGWSLHYAFICLNQSPAVVVDSVLKRLPSGKYYGVAGFTLHTVMFQDAFKHSINSKVSDILKEVAQKREPVIQGGTAPAAARPIFGLKEILGYSTREKLEFMARDYGLDPSPHKKLKKMEFIDELVPFLEAHFS